MNIRKAMTALLLAWGCIGLTFGDHHKSASKPTFVTTFLAGYGNETNKLISLAEAFPEEGFEWRPAEGIRSVREVVLHVAAANYNLASRFMGKAMPEGVSPRQFDGTIKSKTEAISVLKDSIQFVKEAVSGMDEAGLAESIKLFGQDSNRMGAVLAVGGHAYEHLGQLIAYARSSGVVPPWSQ